MVMYRFDFKARTRKDAQGGADLVRYLRREGEFAPKVERDTDVDYMTRQSVETAAHADLVGKPWVGNLPAWAEGSAGKYFAAARAYEAQHNAQYAIALQIALPRELDHAQQMALAQDFIDATLHDKPYLLVKHEPVKDGQPQPHLHILVGPRTKDDIARSPQQHFRRYNPDHPDRGGAQKDRFWNQRQAPRQLRLAFSDLANYHLECAGVEVRIDPRSLRGQGIERDRIRWGTTERPDAETREREQRRAAQAWERRKAHKDLGNVSAIPREEMVLLVRQWTRQYEPGPQLPRASQAEVIAWHEREVERLTAEIGQLERQYSRNHGAHMIAQQRQRQGLHQRGLERTPRARGQDLSRVGIEDDSQGLHGPVLDKKRERGRDGWEW